MTTPARTQPPEAAGPGVEGPSGEVIFGHDQAAPRVHVEPPIPAWQRDANRAEAARHARCSRCMDVPDGVIASIAAALRTAAREGRLR